MRVCPYCQLILPDSQDRCPHDGELGREADAAPVPAVLHAKFSEIETYAQGATGTSFRAQQTASRYAGLLKVVPVAQLDASERGRIRRELRKQTKLTNNSLVRIIDGGEVDAEIWLFRDFVEGESLAQRIHRQGRIELGEALATAAQIATALDELHRNGLLHRDVKPGHVILELRDGAVPIVKLIDAGVAARLETGAVFDLVGTPAYMSPEQASGKLVSFRSDLYALGCVLHEMLTGEPPFTSDDTPTLLEAHRNQPPPALPDEVPTAIQNLVSALLAKEPRKRPFSAQQVRRTLEPLLPDTTPAARSASTTSAGIVRAPGGGAFPREDNTEEIDLEEADAIEAEALEMEELTEGDFEGEGRATMNLTIEELAELAVDDDAPRASDAAAAAAAGDGPRADRAADAEGLAAADKSSAEVDRAVEDTASDIDVQVDEDATEADSQATQSGDADASSDAAEDAEGSAVASAGPATAADPVAGEPAAPPDPADASVRAGRPSVDFDVESLFDDEVPTDQGDALAAAAPTQLFRPEDDEVKPTAIYQPGERAAVPVAPKSASSEKGPPWGMIGAAIALVALLLWWMSGDEAEPAASDTSQSGALAEAEAAPTPAQQAAVRAEPSPVRAPAKAAEPAGKAEPAGPSEAAQEPEAAAEAPSAEPDDSAEQEEDPAAAPEQAAQDDDGKAAEVAREDTNDDADDAAGSRSAGKDSTGKVSSARGSAASRKKDAAEAKEQAREHYRAARYKDAAKAYEKATRLVPSDAGAFAGLGASRLAAGDESGAIKAYQRAVSLQPKSSGFHAALGRAYFKKGDRPRAKKAYARALELNPKNAAAKEALSKL